MNFAEPLTSENFLALWNKDRAREFPSRLRLDNPSYCERLRNLYTDSNCTQVQIVHILNEEFALDLTLPKLKKDASKLQLRKYNRKIPQGQNLSPATSAESINSLASAGNGNENNHDVHEYTDPSEAMLVEQFNPWDLDITADSIGEIEMYQGISKDLASPVQSILPIDNDRIVSNDKRSFSISTVSDSTGTYSTPSEYTEQEREEEFLEGLVLDKYFNFSGIMEGDEIVPEEYSL